MLKSLIARRTLRTTVKASLIALSVGAGLTVMLFTVLTLVFSTTAEKTLELSQAIQIDDAEAIQIEPVEETPQPIALAPVIEDEPQPAAPVALAIPANASRATLLKMADGLGLELPSRPTKGQILAALRAA
jgi:hypothetical protein